MSRKMEDVKEPKPDLRERYGEIIKRLDPQALIQQAIQSGATIETLERLVTLAKDVRASAARELWYRAIADFQRLCPPLARTETATIRTKGGATYSYSYAPLDAILATITPPMSQLGLSVSFRQRHEPDRVYAVCRISHEGGHYEESGEVAMPVSQDDGSGAGAAQRVGIASTYAKRYALKAVLGIEPEKSEEDGNDPGEVGGKIEEPRRASAQASEPASAPQAGKDEPSRKLSTGLVTGVRERTGTKKDGTPWTLYLITLDDGKEYGTFSASEAAFAREADRLPIRIVSERTEKGLLKVVEIGPW